MTKGHALFCIFLIIAGTIGGAECYLKHESIWVMLGTGVPILMGVFGILEKCE